MNKAELITALQNHSGLANKKDIEAVLEGLSAVITETLKAGDDVTLIGLGKFSVQAKPERQGRNPKTGEALTIAASNSAKFTVAKALKDALN
ncbi:HU family DNA-binding protein [Deefgea sp. CFH1-16]|uniref:HU family DNA-binding protein n=1 Tax=Deefgea sp. CFH1-16 TaxID=2675457 RepID=UPI0015F54346|nr:HU family DNA-binding protein [Deefgea sp. CFH1-16]MBM5575780.1 DNA-binding protein HU [Deefgea sp. CFH1-16]